MHCIELRNLLLRVLSAAAAAVLVLRHLFAPSLWTISLDATVREREKCIQKKRRKNENGKGGIKQKNEWCSVKCGCSACVDIITKADNYMNCFRPPSTTSHLYIPHALAFSLSLPFSLSFLLSHFHVHVQWLNALNAVSLQRPVFVCTDSRIAFAQIVCFSCAVFFQTSAFFPCPFNIIITQYNHKHFF